MGLSTFLIRRAAGLRSRLLSIKVLVFHKWFYLINDCIMQTSLLRQLIAFLASNQREIE